QCHFEAIASFSGLWPRTCTYRQLQIPCQGLSVTIELGRPALLDQGNPRKSSRCPRRILQFQVSELRRLSDLSRIFLSPRLTLLVEGNIGRTDLTQRRHNLRSIQLSRHSVQLDTNLPYPERAFALSKVACTI